VNPEVLEKLLQEAQKESSSQSHSPLFLLAETPLPSGHNEFVTLIPNESSTLIISSTQLGNHQKDIYGEIVDGSNDPSTSFIVQMEEHSCSSINSPITIITPPTFAPSSSMMYKNNSSKIKQDVSMLMNTNTKSCLQECAECAKNRQEINKLLEIQLEQQRQILMLRKQNEDNLLSRSPQLLSSSHSLSHVSNEDSKAPSSSSSTEPSTPPALANRRRQSNSSLGFNHSTYSGIENSQGGNCENNNAEYGGFLASNTINKAYGGQSNDWMKYFSSRPQINPPK
jgi:hypothetical protein